MFGTNRQKWIGCVALALWSGIAVVTSGGRARRRCSAADTGLSRPDAWAAWPGRPG